MPVRASGVPSGAATITSKFAFSPSPSERPENSGLTPIIGPSGVTGSVSLRSTARPPASAMRTVTCASSGRVAAGCLSSVTVNLALPLRSVSGRSSSGWRRRFDLFVAEAELIAGKARALVGRRDHHLAFEIEVGGRRAIEIAAVDA